MGVSAELEMIFILVGVNIELKSHLSISVGVSYRL
jgi:hypothetical protein